MRNLVFVAFVFAVFFAADAEGKGLLKLKRNVTRRVTCTADSCGSSVTRSRTVDRSVERMTAQKICEIKAAHAAYYRIKSRHVLMRLGFGGGTFEGCGFTSAGDGDNCPTCTPNKRKMCIGDAKSWGGDGWYRVRIWR